MMDRCESLEDRRNIGDRIRETRMKAPFPHSYWLEPGRIVCGHYPRDLNEDSEHKALSALLHAGVRTFVDLTEGSAERLKPYDAIAMERARSIGIDPASLRFRSHPIRDVSVPNSLGEMRTILRAIRFARHSGETLYIHCVGGRGRTGTVAGCLLGDIFGRPGDEALNGVAKHWKTCPKSVRGASPETAEQRHYVKDWNPVSWPRLDAVRSGILGAAVGDALGVPVEFQRRSCRREDPVVGMREYGTHHQPAGTWSDDTSMILATMAGLEAARRYAPEAVMRQFSGWRSRGDHTPHGTVFDIGNATRAAIAQFETGVEPLKCGGSGETSNGNGSLMRILPIALAYADDPDLILKASEMSALTHAHERSRFCCAFLCLVASDLLHGGSIREATEFAWETLDRRWTFSHGERQRFDRLRPRSLFSRSEDRIGASGHVIDTLEAALWVNARHDSYAEAVLHAVNLGDDTDTTGCVAGGLAGLIHGEAGIPPGWLEVLVKRLELEERCEAFSAFCEKEVRAAMSDGGES